MSKDNITRNLINLSSYKKRYDSLINNDSVRLFIQLANFLVSKVESINGSGEIVGPYKTAVDKMQNGLDYILPIGVKKFVSGDVNKLKMFNKLDSTDRIKIAYGTSYLRPLNNNGVFSYNVAGNRNDDDAIKYIGNGYIQFTGANNYYYISKITGVDIFNNPSILNTDYDANLLCSLAFCCMGTDYSKINKYGEDLVGLNYAALKEDLLKFRLLVTGKKRFNIKLKEFTSELNKTIDLLKKIEQSYADKYYGLELSKVMVNEVIV